MGGGGGEMWGVKEGRGVVLLEFVFMLIGVWSLLFDFSSGEIA